MNGILVDSDVLIDVLRQRRGEVVRSWTALANSNQPVFYSPVSSAEIRQGMRDRETGIVETLFDGLACVAIDEQIGHRAGDYLRAFRASHSLALGDALIAASASVHDLRLWTHNRKHFPMKDLQFFATLE